MSENIIEYGRKLAVNQLFQVAGFNHVWDTWKETILADSNNGKLTANQIYNLGDKLRNIFRTTGKTGRSQSDVSGGGANWEALVCWYLNLCLIGRRTVVIKHNKKLIPDPVSMAITVNYGTFRSNTESDLIAITFPDKEDYENDKEKISITDADGNCITANTSGTYQYLPIINALTARDFPKIEIHVIQCKTNWNDNAQIPMLWDAIYSANSFSNNISVGSGGYSINRFFGGVKRFTYSFVTVPSNQLQRNGVDAYKINSTAVLRVRNLSGGNYWGLPTKEGVALSVKEMLNKNLQTGASSSIFTTLNKAIPELSTTYHYFRLL